MTIKSVFLFLFFGWMSSAFAQPAERHNTREEYINMFKDEAVKEMKRTGIPASITLAQGILESGDGNSPLARYANNHFGIKCHDWKGATFIQDDDAKDECFRKYKNPNQSFKDHSEFLTTRNRYAFLFQLRPTDYVAWAHGLKKAGYATNPKYPELLIRIIEENNLHAYDKQYVAPTAQININKAGENLDLARPSTAGLYQAAAVFENRIKYTKAGLNDSPKSIAQKFNMAAWQIKKYNDLESEDYKFERGEMVFLQPKRRKSKQKTHVVKKGDTPWSIAQKYGIKLERLSMYNSITRYSKLSVGEPLKLRP